MLDCRIESVDCSQWLDRGNPACLLFVQCYVLYNRRIPYFCNCIMPWRSLASEVGTACLCECLHALSLKVLVYAYNVRPPLCDSLRATWPQEAGTRACDGVCRVTRL